MPTYIALLRGINLATKRRVAMADLRGWLTDLGYSDVRTLLQSGNAVFRTDTRPATVRTEVEAALAAGAGFSIDCVLRTAAELRSVVEANPFGDLATDPSRHLVSFLGQRAAWPVVDVTAYEPERVHLGEWEAYFWLPNGVQKAKITTAFPTRTGETATVRNWNTVTKLLAMAEAD